MGLPKRVSVLTAAEYLEIESAASYRSEFYQGEMFAMAGGSPKHSRIKTNFTGALWAELRGQPCAPYDSDLKILCPTGLYTYPDASVVCGPLEVDALSPNSVTNPTLIVEVLSKTTEAYDRGKKFDHYGTIRSLREYVLVSQDEPRIRSYLRHDDGSWRMNAVTGLEGTVRLESIGCELRLADIYDRVDFNEPDEG